MTGGITLHEALMVFSFSVGDDLPEQTPAVIAIAVSIRQYIHFSVQSDDAAILDS
jgi:hypothetical protein